jgi:signal transduction histidine kinase
VATDVDVVLAGGGEMGALMRATDWSRTPLGPLATWSTTLRSVVSMALHNAFPMCVWWGDDLLCLYNDAYRPILGGKHPSALGAPGREVWSEIWPIVGPQADRILAGGAATWNEHLLLPMMRKGWLEETYFTFSYSPITHEASVAGVLITCQETTLEVQNKRQLDTLRELGTGLARARTQREVVTVAAQVLSRNDADLPHVELFVGRPAPAWAGRGTAAVTIVDAPPGLRRGRWGSAPTRAFVAPVRAAEDATADGVLLVGASPVRDASEGYVGFVRLLADAIGATLARTRADEEERERTAALAELDRAKTRFFGNVSHELRTPLTLLLGPTEQALVAGGALSGADLELVHRNAMRLLRLVNALLDVARVEAGALVPERAPVDLTRLTADLATQFQAAIEAAGLRLDLAIAPLPHPVAIDPSMWEKIVLNLLANALKFTFVGSIRVTLEQRGGDVELEVADTGDGIAEAHLPHIFERFQRVPGARSRSHEGSGIGLSLVAELVRLHGGGIEVESRVGQGSRFVVRIPAQGAAGAVTAAPVRSTAVRSLVAEAARWSAPIAEPSPGDDGRPRILVVDDSADMRDFLRRTLEPRFHVELAADGDGALSAIARRPPDLVLSDVMMPGLDGEELVRRLRVERSTATLPVILLTARAGEEAQIAGLTAGANDYVVKPFVAAELHARIAAQLQLAAARQAVDRERQELSRILAQAPVAIAVWRGPEHVFELANSRYEEIFGRRAAVGRRVRDVYRDARLDLRALWDIFDRVYRTGEPYFSPEYAVPWTGRAASRREAYFAFTLSPLRDADGAVTGLVAVAVDVTEQVLARRHGDDLRLAAENANRAKDEFLAMLGHELRNPVAPILTALRLVRLREGGLGRELVIIERQVQHLVRLIDDLLDVSRITRGKTELRTTFLELAEAVAQGLEVASPLLEQREHAVSLDVPAKGLGVVGDPARLAQVVSNILTNAAKYTPPRGHIAVQARADADAVVLSVRDDGVGIAPEMLPRVFEPFVQARQPSDRASGGLGLGLAIVKSLVSLHGGAVEARSEGRGRGTEVIVRLPRAATTAAGADAAPRASGSEASADNHRILVVDDNVDAALMLCEYLSAQGHAVAVAHDGPHALDQARDLHPDVALLDIGLPVMDGYELARLLRETSAGLRLIALTGYGQAADRERSIEAGFDAHLVKPVDLEVLDRVVAGSPGG